MCLKLKHILTHLWDRICSTIEYVSAFPFAEPRMAVLYGTFAGIVLAAGVELVFKVLTNDTDLQWGMKETGGTLLILASLVMSLIAWLLQIFDGHLVRLGKSGEGISEKIAQFNAWKGRWFARFFLLSGTLLLLLAIGLIAGELISASRPDCTGSECIVR